VTGMGPVQVDSKGDDVSHGAVKSAEGYRRGSEIEGRTRIRVLILLGMILLLASSFLTFDWTQYALGLVRLEDPERMYSRLTKTLTSFLVFMLTMTISRDGVEDSDRKKLQRSFVAIFAGDLLFLMDELHPAFDYAAVGAFLVGHVLIILRNGQGIRSYFRGKSRVKDWRVDLFTGIGILLLTGAVFVLTLLEPVKGTPLLPIFIVYSLVLDVSLWMGWASLRTGYFPRENAVLIAMGATFFFLGDLLVGFNLSLGPSIERVRSIFLTWVFYTPAIALLALSGYRWRGRSTE